MFHSHHHGDGHSHSGHDHSHAHPSPDGKTNRAFGLAILLNAGFIILEFTYGFIAHSTALMADAGHNLSDVLGLFLAWGAAMLSRKQPNELYTYGLRSTSILAALINAMLLLFASGAIALEAVQRMFAPSEVAGATVSVIAAVGILVNGFSAWLFMAGRKNDLNIRGAYLHLLADAAVSVGVVVGGLAIRFTGWDWIDPVLCLVIVAVIVISTWGLFHEALRLSLNAVPAHIDLQEVRRFLESQPGVTEVRDLHVWGMSTTETAMSAHLVMPNNDHDDAFLMQVLSELKKRYEIQHSTIQITQATFGATCT